MEGFWSLLQRGIIEIYHWTSKKHIQRYINEFCYRYNTKASKDCERFNNFLLRIENETLN